MLDLKKLQSSPRIYYLLCIVLSMAVFVTAQDNDKDKDKDDRPLAPNLVKVAGKLRCEKSTPQYSIEVPDRPGHALIIAKRACTWAEPLTILGQKAKDGVSVSFTEKMEGALHFHGYETDTMDSGDKLTMQSQGQILADKGPVEFKGRWSLMRGTGKLKGIKGGGTYEGKLEADDAMSYEFEGVYDASDVQK
jgi:hypothetical protein